MNNSEIQFVFFGGEPLAVPTLNALKAADLLPKLIVCNPDRKAGRGQQLTPPPAKVWAHQHGISVYQPKKIQKSDSTLQALCAGTLDIFVVVAYNKILPAWLINAPKFGTVNVHPSLLPALRGASPIRSAILRNEPHHVGVSIMQMDEEMDHGPLLAQQKLEIDLTAWPVPGPILDDTLAEFGGELLATVLPEYISGKRQPQEQEHEHATYCGRLHKDMAELTINPNELPTGKAAWEALLTIKGFMGIGNAWFIHESIRYKITNAHLKGERLVIDTVIPAGKKETDFSSLF